MWRSWLVGLAVVVALGTGAFGLTRVARSVVFQPPRGHAVPAWPGEEPQLVTATTEDGLELQGYYWPATTSNDLLLVFHGNAESQQGMALAAQPLLAGGHGLLIASYRGYGGNAGKPSEEGLYADGEAWMTVARQAMPPGGQLYLFGHSLGGAVALEMAERHSVDGVATLGTFTSVTDMAPWFARPFVLDKFDNAKAIAGIHSPIVLFHGTRDETIPFASAAKLRAASGNRAKVVPIEGGGHNVPMDRVAPLLWKEFH
ncbi:alpha/beta hydrolase [Sphingomonas sp.]|uniref:alpha/beta hydrolase n=1 Tax=Sphingomonas sp. TaxID=28214 RepID=UPI001B2CEDA4|nr:alpha/beta hydrolase [Sphingomonas sp.]MBO9714180.1 alpha/beta hydrolase [Sphingomonas sp.]